MIPKTELIYNYEYARRIQGMTEAQFADPWQRIIRIGGDFEKLIEEYHAHIMELIAKYSGYDWAEHSDDFIPVYMIGAPPSFAQPLSLAVQEDPIEMLADYIYQLTHRNMYFGFPTEEKRHQYTQAVGDHVLGALGTRPVPDEGIDLRERTVKHYLSH